MSKGFSLIEALMAMTVIAIMISAGMFYLSGHQKLYKPDDEALKIIDVLQEARQRSLTQRETMRVEIDLTDYKVRLIDENTTVAAPQPDTADNDKLVREIALVPEGEVSISKQPPDIADAPPENPVLPIAAYKNSLHPLSLNHNVCTIRFLKNGTVVDQGTNNVGAGATIMGLTLYIWSPDVKDPKKSVIGRAVTVVGSSGAIRLWEYDRSSAATNKWNNSRRTGVYGGQATNSNQ